jgi:hypothetical protein
MILRHCRNPKGAGSNRGPGPEADLKAAELQGSWQVCAIAAAGVIAGISAGWEIGVAAALFVFAISEFCLRRWEEHRFL